MIRTIKIELNAAFPNMPLLPFNVYHNSSAAVTVLNVPRMIVSISLKVKNVSGVESVFPLQRTGSAWSAVIPGDFFEQSGTSTRGVKVVGADDAGNAFVLGAADLVVLLDDGTVTPVQPPALTLDDTVTQSSANGVKSSGIWTWVKSLLPSWLTPSREEPPTQAEVDGKVSKSGDTMTGSLTIGETGINNDESLAVEKEIRAIGGFIRFSDSWATGGQPKLKWMGEYFEDSLSGILGQIYIPYTDAPWNDYIRNGVIKGLALYSDIPALVAPSSSATNAQAAAALATYNFVNSSVNAMAAFFLAKDDGTSFATRAELAACTSFLRDAKTGQVPTQNDYTIVVNDETHPIYQAGVFAVYSKWTATADYVGYYVDVTTEGVTAKTLVTAANKDSLGIVVGTTVPYTRIIPTSRYSYQGEWETAGANGWRFQYSINTSGFTVAQLAALNSGVTAELLAQISAALLTIPTSVQKAAWDAKADRASIAPEYSATYAYSVGEFVYRGGRIYRCTTAIAAPGEEWNPAHWSQEQKLDDFFGSSNSLLMGTIRYSHYAVPTGGSLKDRAINDFTFTGSLPNFPAQVSGYARDFLLNVTATADGSDIALPETGATSVGDALAFTAGKTYLVAITEIAEKKYYIRVIDTTPTNA